MEGISGQAWMTLAGSVLNTGFAVVVGWYLLTKAIPKMQDLHLASQEKMQDKQLIVQKDMQAQYMLSQAEQRQAHLKAQVEQRDEYIRSIKEQRESYIEHTEVYRRWFDEREARNAIESKSALQVVITHCEREATRRDELMRTELGLVNTTMRQIMEVVES